MLDESYARGVRSVLLSFLQTPERIMYRGRGTWRARASQPTLSGRGRGRSHLHTPKAPVNESPLGPLVAKIIVDNATARLTTKAEDAKISDCKYAASYSLVDSKLPEVIIPGQPATWKPPQLPVQLSGDHGDYLRDQNGARFPHHPLLPAVQSLFALNDGFNPSSVDILGCASSLGDILRFSRGIASTFRFDIEMVGNTLFLIRNHRSEVIPDVRGYGHTFLDAFTSYGANVEGTKSHQRIVSYSFNGLKCVVRFECDAYFENDGDPATSASSSIALNLLNPPKPAVHVRSAGAAVPQDAIIEIKTRSQAGQPLDMNDHLPRLWLRQIPNLVAAYHGRGNFENIQMNDVKKDVISWETEHTSELQQLGSVLRQLIVEAKRASHLKLELCRTGTGPLELREQNGGVREVLPAYWMEIWVGQQHQGPESAAEVRISDEYDGENCQSPSSDDLSSQSEGSDDDFALDYTACSPSCGYCGHCV
ncbi:hypothetical protein F4818DRAFT_420099 [Hypoxylon cercidicola]|nr:hypothetical protein F4818DRAFT_420099 [Hypoxylon cercidicola]